MSKDGQKEGKGNTKDQKPKDKGMKKTDKRFWEGFWRSTKGSSISKRLIIYKRMDNLFKRFLQPDKSKKLIEIGCAPATWLVYFHKEFGYQVTGLEYLKSGCEASEKNLRANKIPGKIICQDFFNNKIPKESFDYVYSWGFIEHFDPPDEVIRKHAELARKGGRLIIILPNFQGFNLMMMRLTNRNMLKGHNLKIMKKEVFKKEFEKQGIKVISANYIGKLNLTVINWGRIQKTPLIYLIHAINQIIGRLWFFESRAFSPYIYLMGEKE